MSNPAINGNPKLPDVRFSIVPINTSIFPPEMKMERDVKVVDVSLFLLLLLVCFFILLTIKAKKLCFFVKTETVNWAIDSGLKNIIKNHNG